MRKLLCVTTTVAALTILSMADDPNLPNIEQAHWGEIYNPPYKQPTEIKQGNELRKKLFHVLRPAVSKKAGRNVKFSGTIKVYKNWAFFVGDVHDESGKILPVPPMDNSDAAALWLRTSKGWTVVDFSIGHSDVVWEPWPYQYGAPKSIMK